MLEEVEGELCSWQVSRCSSLWWKSGVSPEGPRYALSEIVFQIKLFSK